MNETTEAILTEMADWGRALLAEHERRVCDVHGPVVPSKNMGESLIRYVERLRSTVAEDRDFAERQWSRAVREQQQRIAAEARQNAKPRPFDRPSEEDYRDGSGVLHS